MEKIDLKPIGVVHSPFKEPFGKLPKTPSERINYQGTIEIFPEFKDGLKDLGGFSHIIIIFYFHKAEYSHLIVKPYLDDSLRGVFATRFPHRPNLIGSSVVQLLKIDENILSIRGLDMIEGTPVLDIKPYIPEINSNEDIRVGWLEGKI
jgi:tRNA-Thr(GGU) m(6)t(6)A37 methyltransferase TsaA